MKRAWVLCLVAGVLMGEEVLSVGEILAHGSALAGKEVVCEGVWVAYGGLKGVLMGPGGVVPAVGIREMGEWGRYRVQVYEVAGGIVLDVVGWEAIWPQEVEWVVWRSGGIAGFRDVVVLDAEGTGYVVSAGAGWVQVRMAAEAWEELEGVWERVRGNEWGEAVPDGWELRLVRQGEEGRWWWGPGVPGWLEGASRIVGTWAEAARRARWVEAWAGERWGEGEVVRMEEVWWPDASMGWPREGVFYAQVITPGWRVWIRRRDMEIEVRIPANGGTPITRD
ncbi:hypothetical protein [Spirochaeta thermophila]|nr:hypothetical protein [Spirochaeta thermophila]